jgi:hypothetical protein
VPFVDKNELARNNYSDMNNPHSSESQVLIEHRLMVEEEISTFQRDVLKYRKVLNDESVWLFLATLGCWSVTNGILQFVALIVTFHIFFKRRANLSKDTRTFPEWIKMIEERIAQTSLPEDFKKARLFDLAAFQRKEMSHLTFIKKNWVYFVCWTFYFLTFASLTHIPFPLISEVLHIVPRSQC